MATKSKALQSLADDLRNQHKDLRVDNSYNLLRTAAMLNNFLNKGYRKIGMKQNQAILFQDPLEDNLFLMGGHPNLLA